MHSRIFQVSEKPIDKADYIGESDYWDHWFTNSVADYVSEDCYRDEDLKWFEDCYEHHGIEFGKDDNGEYLIIKSKHKYFENNFAKFMETIDKISTYTIDDFINGIFEMWHLKNAYEEKFGFYIEVDGYGLITMDNFVRELPENVKFYIGGTIDYHC
jgi:hypothetical protein